MGALKYFILKVDPKEHDFQSQNPSILTAIPDLCQYAHAHQIGLRKAAEQGINSLKNWIPQLRFRKRKDWCNCLPTLPTW